MQSVSSIFIMSTINNVNVYVLYTESGAYAEKMLSRVNSCKMHRHKLNHRLDFFPKTIEQYNN